MDTSTKKAATWLVVLALALAACSGLGSTFSDISDEIDSAPASAGADPVGDSDDRATEGAGEGEAESPTDGAEEVVAPIASRTIQIGRDIVFVADLTVAVTDVAAAGDEASAVVAGLGGHLFGEDTTGEPDPRSVLTFKVPPGEFDEALARLGRLGDVRSQTVSADDVTERVVDLRSQITTAEASVDRLRALLAGADDVETIVELENELLDRETRLESLRGSLRTLEDQVSLATIVLTLTEAAAHPALDVTVTAYPGHDDGASCPGAGSAEVEEGAEATFCVEVTNVGDTWLTDLELRDPVLDVTGDAFTVVFGAADLPIEPGGSVMLAHELLPPRDLRTRTTVTMVAVTVDGEPVGDRPVSATVGAFIDTVDPGGIPTFAEGLEASLDFLTDVGAVLVLVAGALLPFLWVPVVAWLVVGWWRRRRSDGEPEAEAGDDAVREEVPAG